MSENRRPAVVERIVNALTYHLDQRPADELALGADPYARSHVEHPMAIAMYTRGLVSLADLTGDERHVEHALVLSRRLDALRAKAGPGLDAWGLGFRWRRSPADEPYVITSALCVWSLVDLYRATGDRDVLQRVRRAARWLVDGAAWSVLPGGAGPRFSARIPYVVPNVAAVTAGALAAAFEVTGDDCLRATVRPAARWVRSQQEPAGLWRYGYTGTVANGPTRPPDVVDSVHSAYVIDGLASVARSHASASGATGHAVRTGIAALRRHLIGPAGRLLEKVVIVDRDDAIARPLLERPRLGQTDLDRATVAVAFPAEARLWSYGAVLGALGRTQSAGLAGNDWAEPLADRLLTVHAARADGRFSYLAGDGAAYPRHEAHAFEGLSQFALTVRDSPLTVAGRRVHQISPNRVTSRSHNRSGGPVG